jgi:hypothetical protein
MCFLQTHFPAWPQKQEIDINTSSRSNPPMPHQEDQLAQ